MSRVKDPDLLAALKPVWREFGCAFCGRSVPSDEEPPSGMDVELAHVVARSRLGPDTAENILGLCGELTPNQCHTKYDRHRIAVKENDWGQLVWMSSEPGGHVWTAVRIPPEVQAMIDDARAASEPEPTAAEKGDGGWNLSTDLAPALPAAAADAPVTVESDAAPADEGELHTPAPVVPAPASAEARYDRLSTLLRRSREDMIEAACHLHVAWQEREYEQLGTDWASYYSGLGLEKSAVSKMLRVGQVFASSWRRLSDADRAELSLERLYLAARIVDHEQLDPDAAIAEAVANPTHQLVARLRGDEPAARCTHNSCPECGASVWHNRKGADE